MSKLLTFTVVLLSACLQLVFGASGVMAARDIAELSCENLQKPGFLSPGARLDLVKILDHPTGDAWVLAAVIFLDEEEGAKEFVSQALIKVDPSDVRLEQAFFSEQRTKDPVVHMEGSVSWEPLESLTSDSLILGSVVSVELGLEHEGQSYLVARGVMGAIEPGETRQMALSIYRRTGEDFLLLSDVDVTCTYTVSIEAKEEESKP